MDIEDVKKAPSEWRTRRVPPTAEILPVVIVGAGPSGLTVAALLARRGVRATVLEAGEAVGWAWRRHYPSLRLHTLRRDSSLPGWPLSRGGSNGATYPTRDEFAEYLQAYARALPIDVRLNCSVHRLRREDAGWEIDTGHGPLRGRHVVMAAGFNRRPVRPELPGEAAFGGPVLHSSQWQELGATAGKRVLVAGLGNTGADLMEDLCSAGAEVAVAVRGPIHLVPREMLGINWRTWYRLAPGLSLPGYRAAAVLWSGLQRLYFGDLEPLGLQLQRPAELLRHWSARRPPLTSGPFLDRIRRGQVRVLPALTGFQPGAAVLADGCLHPCDAVVLATGFRPALDELLEPGILPPGGLPPDGLPGLLPGLWFCGYRPELIRIRRTARRIARGIAANLARHGPARRR